MAGTRPVHCPDARRCARGHGGGERLHERRDPGRPIVATADPALADRIVAFKHELEEKVRAGIQALGQQFPMDSTVDHRRSANHRVLRRKVKASGPSDPAPR